MIVKRGVYNFYGGMTIYPPRVIEEARRDLLEYKNTGLSILEISHRSQTFRDILDQAEQNLRQLMNIPDNYHVLFLQGGESLQFSMIPINFLRGRNRPANYIVTGYWSKMAIKEARREGKVNIIWDGNEEGFIRTPQRHELRFDTDAAYVYYTTSETVEGIQFPIIPDVGDIPLVCDMCSDFITKPIDVTKYALISAHGQKNAGIAGVSIIIIRDDFLKDIPDNIHTMLDYRPHIDNHSIYNTPPVFAIYTVLLMTQWLIEDIGGLKNMDKLAKKRAKIIYDLLDESSDFYKPHAQCDSRSLINIVFKLPTDELTEKFIMEGAQKGLIGLQGHRSLGGIRASFFNPMSMNGVHALRDFMIRFRKKYTRIIQ
uniref:Phosphoserine aminotransferase n=1 Tax=Candidatus Kentrum sp. TC TaxID=2126339 RepID=A0A450Z5D3_9GAMM|nr:MAG: phosphoserine aminotransferase [Candidatus Kentron sp. TC]VFK48996.1 MAG: phosphoserine aminotransferase apoenzyme [Candidatus Kentron sp. TC]VFK61865.1 MAG: phosphoserine aminotransferase [Candidatus Kentron sp. TC]